jgi:hypothetical protein
VHWRLGDQTQARDYYGRALRRVEDQREELPPVWREELPAFRAEAAGLTAMSKW